MIMKDGMSLVALVDIFICMYDLMPDLILFILISCETRNWE
jgi:hypothetical protein